MKKISNNISFFIALLFTILVSFLYFNMKVTDNLSSKKIPVDTLLNSPASEPPQEPRFPIPENAFDKIERPDLIAIPALGESDQYLHLGLSEIFDEAVVRLLSKTILIEKIVATIDNLPRQHIAERMRPISAQENSFIVETQAGVDNFTLSARSYDRYTSLIDHLLMVDIDELANIYLRFYPLFQEAYEDLGYPQAYFNDRVIDVIEHLLNTPEVNDPIILHRPHVLYEFIHPELEALSGGQKLLIRLGIRNSAKVKQFLIDFKTLIS